MKVCQNRCSGIASGLCKHGHLCEKRTKDGVTLEYPPECCPVCPQGAPLERYRLPEEWSEHGDSNKVEIAHKEEDGLPDVPHCPIPNCKKSVMYRRKEDKVIAFWGTCSDHAPEEVPPTPPVPSTPHFNGKKT